MSTANHIKVIFDTNVLVSFLIGKRINSISRYLYSPEIEVIISDELIMEFYEVTTRSKFKKYFDPADITTFITLIELNSKRIKIQYYPEYQADEKDAFLLGLALSSDADFLVTGDKQLLKLGNYKQTDIVRSNEFDKIISKR